MKKSYATTGSSRESIIFGFFFLTLATFGLVFTLLFYYFLNFYYLEHILILIFFNFPGLPLTLLTEAFLFLTIFHFSSILGSLINSPILFCFLFHFIES